MKLRISMPLMLLFACCVLTSACTRYTQCDCYVAGHRDTSYYFHRISLAETQGRCATLLAQTGADSCHAYLLQRK